MKKFLATFLFCLSLLPSVAFAQKETKIRTRPYSEAENIDVEATLRQFIETAKFFDEKYPKEKITDDMHDDIKAFFPELNEQQIYDLQLSIREGLSVYRYFKEAYETYKEKLLTPEEPPLIVDDDQYVDLQNKPDYIDTEDGVVIVTDIKSVVPYSNNPRDLKSAQAKTIRDLKKAANKKGDFDDLIDIASRIEFKKIPFYDVIYPNPLTGQKGIGDWDKKDKIKMRLLTEQTGVKDAAEIKGLIHITIPKDKIIIANDGHFHKPEISFERSENLKNWTSTLPMPLRFLTEDRTDWTIYSHEVAIPVNFEVSDTEKPLVLRADITVDVCNDSLQCAPMTFTPELTLASAYTRNSAVATFVYQSSLNVPPEQSDKLKIDTVKVKQLPKIGKFLEIELSAAKKVSAFQIFISSPDNIVFEAPRINIDNKKITVRFLPVDSKEELSAYIYEINAVLNKQYMLRSYHAATEENDTDPVRQSLSWKLIIAAFFGGLLLNLMPCVFPVLSVKLLSLTKFGARQNANVRRNFYYTLLGIAVSLGALASFLALLKYLGHSIGWGMQFQNPYFVITMIFAILLFLLSVTEIVSLQLPNKLQNILNTKSPDSLTYLLTGILVVLMSTPCTAPYLGTAIGFALAGSIADIYFILGAVGLGLALPYLLLYLFPPLIVLVPTPGPWMRKLNTLMFIMLLLTLIWLFSILLAQTETMFIVRLGIYVLLSAIALCFNSINRDTEYTDLSPIQRQKAKNFFSTILISITAIFYIIALTDGHFAYNKHRDETKNTTVQSINIKEIEDAVKNGQTVIVAVGADWCLTCKYNDTAVFNLPSVNEKITASNVKFIKIDWTNYNREVLKFMEKYQRSGLPFYILFSPLVPDGIVLPEILNDNEFNNLIRNFTL